MSPDGQLASSKAHHLSSEVGESKQSPGIPLLMQSDETTHSRGGIGGKGHPDSSARPNNTPASFTLAPPLRAMLTSFSLFLGTGKATGFRMEPRPVQPACRGTRHASIQVPKGTCDKWTPHATPTCRTPLSHTVSETRDRSTAPGCPWGRSRR